VESGPGNLKHRELNRAFYDVYNELGHGFLEIIYERSLAIALARSGMKVEVPVPVPVWFRGIQIGDFRAEMTFDGKVLLELKAARTIDQAHEKQLLNYFEQPISRSGYCSISV
jgi:GxxExxY protein